MHMCTLVNTHSYILIQRHVHTYIHTCADKFIYTHIPHSHIYLIIHSLKKEEKEMELKASQGM